MWTAEYDNEIDDAEIPQESPIACANCGETYPDSALDSDGRCERCLIKAHRRRDAYFNEADCGGVVDAFGYVHSDADPGL